MDWDNFDKEFDKEFDQMKRRAKWVAPVILIIWLAVAGLFIWGVIELILFLGRH